MLTNTTSAPKTHKLIILNKLHANRHRTHVSIIDTYIHNLLLNLYHNSKFLNFLIFNMPARNKKQQKYETQTLKMTLTQISHHFSRKSPPLVLLSITPCDCLWTLHPLPPPPLQPNPRICFWPTHPHPPPLFPQYIYLHNVARRTKTTTKYHITPKHIWNNRVHQPYRQQPFMGAPRYPPGPRPGVRMPQGIGGNDFNGVSIYPVDALFPSIFIFYRSSLPNRVRVGVWLCVIYIYILLYS